MKLLGYEVNNRTVYANATLIAGAAAATSLVVYGIVSYQCGNENYSDFNVSTQREYAACQPLQGSFMESCPEGFPQTYELCIQGFRSGTALVEQGIRSFIPANLTRHVCNEHFGFNQSLVQCYTDLTHECWFGAWGGFNWASAIKATAQVVNSNCEKVASHAAGAAAGLLFFAGCVGAGVNAVLNRSASKKISRDDEALTTELLESENVLDSSQQLRR